MTPLRRRMIEDMRVRNLAANTQRAYLQQVNNFARYFGRSPELPGPEEVRAWQVHLIEVQRRSSSTLVVATAALRFLYHITLKREWAVEELPIARTPRKLPVILSQDEITRFLEAIRNVKHRVVTRAHVLAWRKTLETRGLSGATIRHKLAALSSLFEYLCEKNAVDFNPVKGAKRPKVDSNEGKTPALGDHQARAAGCARSNNSQRQTRPRAAVGAAVSRPAPGRVMQAHGSRHPRPPRRTPSTYPRQRQQTALSAITCWQR